MPGDLVPPTDLVQLARRALRRDPDHVAVRDDERSLTYAELIARAEALSRHLREDLGVRRGDRVALCVRRGVDVVVGMLGVVMAGAAYVAVDPRLPAPRCALMVDASGSRVLLADGSQPFVVNPLVVVEQWRSRPTPRVDAVRDHPLHGADLACVMFTSGSSGTPKAIMVEHRNLVALATSPSLPELHIDDVFGQVASLSFDTVHVEIWGSIAAGAAIAVLPTMPELINGDLHRELRRRQVSVLLAPTMAVNHIVHEDRDAFASLRVLQTGGDVLQPAACKALMSGSFTGELWNLYGPTEATTASSCHRVATADTTAPSVPIGTALADEELLILDDELCAVPTGQLGELYIAGVGVTRGYLGSPARTAERFLPQPGRSGARMYRTGDRVLRRVDGAVEFHGRVDEQVKVRGYRVEPREVEYLIGQHPAVREAVIVVVGDAHDKHLVALVALSQDISPAQLRIDVGRTMPDYLVPSSFVVLPTIPGTDHGKRDLDELGRIAHEQLQRRRAHEEPVDEVEVYLAQLWADLLRLELVGRDDDFFALGGNSLLAFRARRRIARQLGVSVDVPEILDARELHVLASLIRDRMTDRPSVAPLASSAALR